MNSRLRTALNLQTEVAEVLAVHALVLQEVLGHALEGVGVLAEYGLAPDVGLVKDALLNLRMQRNEADRKGESVR